MLKNIKELICATVSAYILYVKLLAKQYDHQIIICGVPAPNIKLGTMSIEDAKEFTYLIQAFNNELKSEAIAAGMDFLDVYALTNQGRGVASGYWHIDSYHLLPSAIVESFANYCSRS